MADLPISTFTVELRHLRGRLDPGYAGALRAGREWLANSPYSVVELGTILELAQYGTSERAASHPVGVPVLRMGNLKDEGLSAEGLKYVDLGATELQRYLLRPGDILFNRTNSKELVGKCAVFDLSGDWVFASYLIRLRVDTEQADPRYVSRFLMSAAGRLQIDRLSRQAIGMANINLGEIRGLLLPLPPVEVQQRLSEQIDDAWLSRVEMLGRAQTLEENLGANAAEDLGLPVRSASPPNTFTISVSALQGRRIDVAANRPAPPLGRSSGFELISLEGLAEIDSERIARAAANSIPYVGLPECSRTSIQTISQRNPEELGSASVARPGDILIARIEPSVFNRKFVFIESLPPNVERVATSGEFYVVRAEQGAVDPRFLYAMFFTDYLYAQIIGKTTGSSGRRRIPRDLFGELQIPVPGLEKQLEIGRKFISKRSEAQRIRRLAADHWAEARAEFDQALGGE